MDNQSHTSSPYNFLKATFNPKKADKYKVKDDYEDHADGILETVDPAAVDQANRPPISSSSSVGDVQDKKKQKETTHVDPNNQQAALPAVDNGLKAFQHASDVILDGQSGVEEESAATTTTANANNDNILNKEEASINEQHHQHQHGNTDAAAPSAPFDSASCVGSSTAPRNRGLAGGVRGQSFAVTNSQMAAATTSSIEIRSNNPDFDTCTDEERGAIRILTSPNEAPPTPPSSPINGNTAQNNALPTSSTTCIGPQAESAYPQLLSLSNPDSLLGDYIPLPEDAIPSLTFRVVKQHHRMSWLKQSRLIVVTGSDLRNCKEGEKKKSKEKEKQEEEQQQQKQRALSAGNLSSYHHNNDALVDSNASATKIIPFSSITRLSLTSKISFAVHVLGDHTYYYISEHSLEIVWAIRKRMSICAAIAKLVRGTTAGADQLRELARAFMTGELMLPQFSAGADFFSTGAEAVNTETCPKERRKEQERQQKEKESRAAAGLDSVFSVDKAAAEALRYATNMKHRMAIIDALKNDVLPEESARIRTMIEHYKRLGGGGGNGKNGTSSSSHLSSSGDAAATAPDTVGLIDTSVLHEIRTAIDELRESIADLLSNPDARTSKQQHKYLPDIYDVGIARSVSDEAIQTTLLTAIHGVIWSQLHLQSELVALESKFRQQCKFLRNEVSPQELGVPEKCLEFHYDLVLETIRRIATAKTPHVMLEEITACCKSIVLTISAGTQFGFVRADLPCSIVSTVLADYHAERAEEEEARRRSELSAEEQHALAALDNDGTLPKRPKKKAANTLAADDILPILIFLIIHANVNDMIYVREYVNSLGDPEEASERSYYYTMFSSAVEYVLASAEEVKRMREYNAKQKEKEERRKLKEEQSTQNEERQQQATSTSEINPDSSTQPTTVDVNNAIVGNNELRADDDESVNANVQTQQDQPSHSAETSPRNTDDNAHADENKETLVEEAGVAGVVATASMVDENDVRRSASTGIAEDVRSQSPTPQPADKPSANEDADKAAPLESEPASTPTASSTDPQQPQSSEQQQQQHFVFLSPFSAFVQNDVTLNFKKLALIRHQNSTNYNKKATSASSPYAVHNLLKNNPLNVNLGRIYGGAGAGGGGGGPSNSSLEARTATSNSIDNAVSQCSDPYYLQRPRGITTPDGGAGSNVLAQGSFAGGNGMASSYRYV